jgi:ribonuclease HII
MTQMALRPVGMAEYARRVVVRREAGLYAYQAALARAGLVPVAGADEAGRGACAGPLVAAAVILPEGRRGVIDELADSKLLTAAARERVYDRVLDRAVSWAAVVASPAECDLLGMHRVNVQALRRSLRRLAVPPAYVLTDGFGVDGVGVPGLAVWKGDRVAACIAAASVVAKVTRDRIMTELHDVYPQYDFATHKGYCTPEHQQAMQQHGPSPVHRRKWVNVITAARVYAGEIPAPALPGPLLDEQELEDSGQSEDSAQTGWPDGADWPSDGDWPVTMVPRRRLEEESDEH